MADKPILFSATMIRALLGGRKTQTRRVIKPQPPADVVRHCWYNAPIYGFTRDHDVSAEWHKARLLAYNGDRLWVREAWRVGGEFESSAPRVLIPHAMPVFYEDDAPHQEKWIGRFRQGMHMPRWASRLTLIVEGVKVERLQDISEGDAIAEGVVSTIHAGDLSSGKIEWEIFTVPGLPLSGSPVSACDAYADLWIHIHGPGAWEQNPWVAAYTFRVIKQNIDEIA